MDKLKNRLSSNNNKSTEETIKEYLELTDKLNPQTLLWSDSYNSQSSDWWRLTQQSELDKIKDKIRLIIKKIGTNLFNISGENFLIPGEIKFDQFSELIKNLLQLFLE